MSVVLTGATGFVGRHVAQAARARGHAVLALVRDVEAAGRLPWLGACGLVHADMSAPPADWAGLLQGADTVIHLAWTGLPNYKSLAHVVKLSKLEELNLWHTGVTDNGVALLAALTGLKSLNLDEDRQVTDAAMDTVGKLTSLEFLHIGGTSVTDAGLASIRKSSWSGGCGSRGRCAAKRARTCSRCASGTLMKTSAPKSNA